MFTIVNMMYFLWNKSWLPIKKQKKEFTMSEIFKPQLMGLNCWYSKSSLNPTWYLSCYLILLFAALLKLILFLMLQLVGRLDNGAVSATGAKMAFKSNEEIALQVRSIPLDWSNTRIRAFGSDQYRCSGLGISCAERSLKVTIKKGKGSPISHLWGRWAIVTRQW